MRLLSLPDAMFACGVWETVAKIIKLIGGRADVIDNKGTHTVTGLASSLVRWAGSTVLQIKALVVC